MVSIRQIINTIDSSSESFDKVLKKSEKKIFDEAILLIKSLEVNSDGTIKQSVANLKQLTVIKSKLKKLTENKEYLSGLAELTKVFGELQKQQTAYFNANFPEATQTTATKEKRALMKSIATENTINALAGTGLQANVTDKLNDILLRAVTSKEKFADLQEELRNHLIGIDGGSGALSRYASTYAVTAMSQFTGQNNKLLTRDIGVEWFMYVGSNKETTREFCQHLTKKRYVHISEIPDLLNGKIDDHQCAIYNKTGLPYGMIDGTNAENFQVNCGGWGCRHQLVPVHKLAVPKDLRVKFDSYTEEEIALKKSRRGKEEENSGA